MAWFPTPRATLFKHLLVPIDGSALSAQAITAALGLARELGAAITAFIAEPPSRPADSGQGLWHCVQEAEAQRRLAERHAESVLAAFAHQASAAGVPFEGLYAQSKDIDAAIDAVAHQRGCDLIVMATHGRGRFGGRWASSWTRRVMTRSRLPLLVVH